MTSALIAPMPIGPTDYQPARVGDFCKWYDVEAATAFAKKFFRAESVQVKTCLRQ